MHKIIQLGLVALVFSVMAPEFCFGQPTRRMISLEISADRKAPVGTQQQWIQMLQSVGADKVISRTASPELPAVEEIKTPTMTLLKVTGFVSGRNIFLPGGKFSIRDKNGIRNLLQRLREDGATVALAEKLAFGLTAEQLVGLHEKLSKEVDFNTAGQRAGDVIKRMTEGTRMSFLYDRAATAAVNGEETVQEELKGISTGTALATVLRPLGLVLEPKREQGKELQLRILDTRSSKENWPIGWPIEKAPIEVEPKLFDTLPINIQGFPMKAAMDAIEKRAGVRFFYDQNTLAREGIELDKVKVTLQREKVSLLVAVSKLLKQSKPQLWEEIRVDENGKAFLWISTRN